MEAKLEPSSCLLSFLSKILRTGSWLHLHRKMVVFMGFSHILPSCKRQEALLFPEKVVVPLPVLQGSPRGLLVG